MNDTAEMAKGRIDELLDHARERVRQQPLGTVAGAFALGVMIGTGLPARIGRVGALIGLRMLLNRAFGKGIDWVRS